MAEIPKSLQGLRVRLVSSPNESAETRAYARLKELLATHGQHISKKTLALFHQSLNGLLLHGLRTREVEPAEESAADETQIRFRASDGQIYVASDPKAWAEVQKKDPGAKRVNSENEQPKTSLADRLSRLVVLISTLLSLVWRFD